MKSDMDTSKKTKHEGDQDLVNTEFAESALRERMGGVEAEIGPQARSLWRVSVGELRTKRYGKNRMFRVEKEK